MGNYNADEEIDSSQEITVTAEDFEMQQIDASLAIEIPENLMVNYNGEEDQQIDSGQENTVNAENFEMPQELQVSQSNGDKGGSNTENEPKKFDWKIYDQPILPNCETTIVEAIVLILNFVFLHDLTWEAMEDLFKLINVILGFRILPQTKYLLAKLFGGMNSDIIFHVYCPECQLYLDKASGSQDRNRDTTCTECNTVYKIAQLIKKEHFFVTISIRDQLKSMLEDSFLCTELCHNLKNISRYTNNQDITDITDGMLYQKMRKKLQCTKYDLTLTLNTDGSPIFKSSKTSMWPIQFTINELPPKLRWKNVLMAGIWFGKKHPNMVIFMEHAFVQEMKDLSSVPITWTSDDVLHESRLFAVCACLDSPARAVVQNTVQFNGCSWCLHPGETHEGNPQVKYNIQPNHIPDRSHTSILRDMETALVESRVVHGVKGPSPLINLLGFDMVWSFSPDYMHGFLLGVTRQMAELWFTCTDSDAYIGSPTQQTRHVGSNLAFWWFWWKLILQR